jgi:hypothetical protein
MCPVSCVLCYYSTKKGFVNICDVLKKKMCLSEKQYDVPVQYIINERIIRTHNCDERISFRILRY